MRTIIRVLMIIVLVSVIAYVGITVYGNFFASRGDGLVEMPSETKARYEKGERIIKKEQLPDEEFLSLEMVYSSVHSGTHLDYSFHYGSQSEGKPSKTADEIPLEWCYHDGVKINLTHKKANEVITAQDIEKALSSINYQIKPFDIVLLHTGSDKLFGKPEYFSDYPGIAVSTIDYLLDSGVRIFGVDSMGIDRPYKFMMKDFQE